LFSLYYKNIGALKLRIRLINHEGKDDISLPADLIKNTGTRRGQHLLKIGSDILLSDLQCIYIDTDFSIKDNVFIQYSEEDGEYLAIFQIYPEHKLSVRMKKKIKIEIIDHHDCNIIEIFKRLSANKKKLNFYVFATFKNSNAKITVKKIKKRLFRKPHEEIQELRLPK
jgi:hypothetical protein